MPTALLFHGGERTHDRLPGVRRPAAEAGHALFLSVSLLAYAAGMAICVHVFVIGYEEPTLGRRFGETYAVYRLTVPRWIPRRPQRG